MALFDMPHDKLEEYKPALTAQKDFERFWSMTLKETESYPISAEFVKLEDPFYKLVEAYDVTFNGYDGQPVKGWFIVPAGSKSRLPCVVSFIGYGGGRSFPVDHMWPLVGGYAHFVMDTRGQGGSWSPGHTSDEAAAGPSVPGFMTRGIESRENYYYRRVFADGVRAVEAACSNPRVDARRIAVTGGSQGGGITIAVAGLVKHRAKLAMADVPFLCHFRRGVTLIDSDPYGEITRFLKTHRDQKDKVFKTLSYFDGMNFAPRITARCLFSVALMDMVCPPSTVYAAYNHLKAKKEIRVYDFNNHEGGGVFQMNEKLAFLARNL
ncbi:MAG: acetylxylan esterase [Verrucomicrobia bacterium]|nr:acetylxylan esterase [Verrucomicrobiota bacterium]